MPKILRSMMAADDGLPEVRDSSSGLGVRTEGQYRDVRPDAEGLVKPGRGGMSVVSDPRRLLPHQIPRALKDMPDLWDASGRDGLVLWQHGEGEFEAAPVAESLRLRPDRRPASEAGQHGLVEPAATMSLEEYRQAIRATRADWRQWEG